MGHGVSAGRGDIRRLSRRQLLRLAAVTGGSAALLGALPDVASADGPGPGGPTDLEGAGGLGEAGADLSTSTQAPTGVPVELTRRAPRPVLVPVSADLPYTTFARFDFPLRDLPPELMPYALDHPVPVTGYGLVDGEGVRMNERYGQPWNHPTAQAQYGMALLESHRLTGDARYLDLALRQAGRIIKRARAYRGGLFHPFDFPYRHVGTWRVPPWYSGLAQGQVLDFMTRLYRVTGNAGHLAEARGTFASLLVPAEAGKPWGVWMAGDQIWFDEYPSSTSATGDRTYNGHNSIGYGLYQYWLLTKDERARQLAQGAFTTTRRAYPALRVPGWRSYYCLTDRADSQLYHHLHVRQLLKISTITGDPYFAAIADVFHQDFPDARTSGSVVFAPGVHAGYQFDVAGGVTGSRLIHPLRQTSAPSGARTRIRTHEGLWYQITAGSFAGYSVLERPAFTYQRGQYVALSYLPYRSGLLTRTVQVAIQPVDATSGRVLTKSVSLDTGSRVEIDMRSTINGAEHLRLAEGPDVGWWVPAEAVRL